jgi:hypothetical protein
MELGVEVVRASRSLTPRAARRTLWYVLGGLSTCFGTVSVSLPTCFGTVSLPLPRGALLRLGQLSPRRHAWLEGTNQREKPRTANHALHTNAVRSNRPRFVPAINMERSHDDGRLRAGPSDDCGRVDSGDTLHALARSLALRGWGGVVPQTSPAPTPPDTTDTNTITSCRSLDHSAGPRAVEDTSRVDHRTGIPQRLRVITAVESYCGLIILTRSPPTNPLCHRLRSTLRAAGGRSRWRCGPHGRQASTPSYHTD